MSNQKKRQNYQSDSFLEAFRELGSHTANSGKDAVSGIAADVVRQVTPGGLVSQSISGELRPDQPVSIEAELRRREAEISRRERAHFEFVRHKETLVFSRKQEEIEAQIAAIQEELKKLIGEAVEIAHEVEVAATQAVVEPGVYHLTFFEKLRQLLVLLRKKIADSKTWMHTANARAKRRSYYWAQVGKSGTKFLLSQERYMSTQAG